ncbi:carboxypeptidase-like regulatory domain-containing protein [uncultured Desulfobacter sp.]|uniref:carboxypeptidase-like regulatory domain-containing protein n=1 Tax=uncultured Desulfobacter sp. TaxID=240139 RepID=UPI002AAAB895|nr:carboxypeptidase-like regulatory domain-containing protein [uncultured Desulfobacter sp.]
MDTKTKTKMKPVKMFMAGLLAALLNSSPGWCHGVMGTVDEIKAYCVTAMYDDGEPMSYAKVEVMAPETALPFQSGRTDRNGNFVVNTDTPGSWNVVVSDGMGHRLTLNFSVLPQEAAAIPPGNNTRDTAKETASELPGQDRHWKVISGLSVIFGLWGLFFAWKARQKPIRGNGPNE